MTDNSNAQDLNESIKLKVNEAMKVSSNLVMEYNKLSEGKDIRHVMLAVVYFCADTAVEGKMPLADLLAGVETYYLKILEDGQNERASELGNG